MNLRPYQQDCIGSINAAYAEGTRRMLVVKPTGTGKTFTFANIIQKVKKKDKRPALIVAHRDELLTQAAQTIMKVIPGVQVGFEAAGQKARVTDDVVVASVPTIGRDGSSRLNWLARTGASVLIVDEAHHGGAEGYVRVADRFGAFTGLTPMIGFTATPKRLDSKALIGPHGEALFEKVVYEYPLLQAIKDKWLCPIRGYRVVTQTDISSAKTTAGDFNQKDLAKLIDNEERTAKAIEHWKEHAADRITAVFCVNIAHAQHTAEAWKEAGYRAAYVDSTMDKEERRAVLRDWKAGRIQVVANCGILTEGFDFPAISCIVMLRPTQSWALYCQCVGRGTRISEGKEDLIVLDVCDVTKKHNLASCPSLVDMPADVDLEGETLEEALAVYEEAVKEGRVIPDGPKTLRDIKTATVSIDFFGETSLPEEIKKKTEFNWTPIGSGYILAGSKNKQTGEQRISRLTVDAIGQWRYIAPDGREKELPDDGGLPDFKEADRLANWCHSYELALVKREAEWRKREASPKQIATLTKKGKVPKTIAEKMTMGQASVILDRVFRDGWVYDPAKYERSVAPIGAGKG